MNFCRMNQVRQKFTYHLRLNGVMSSKNQIHDGDVAKELKQSIMGAVYTADIKKYEYSSDASNYRVIPQFIVEPKSIEDIVQAHKVALKYVVPFTMRGGGTSVAGNSIGTGIIVDTSVHLNKILKIDPVAQIAVVEPGVLISDLNYEAAQYGLRFGPDPSTSSRATIGGAIGNNACGPHALYYGKTAENVISLEVLAGNGNRFEVGMGLDEHSEIRKLVLQNLATIRTEFGRFGRQVSGYSLEHLLPENKENLAAAIVGTEGTLVSVLTATVKLVKKAVEPVLVVLSYSNMHEAGDDVQNLLKFKPLAMEGMDNRLIEVAQQHWKSGNFPVLPAGAGWLMVEARDEQSAQEISKASSAVSKKIVTSQVEVEELWRLRSDGAGFAGRTVSGNQAWPGWEDAAVPPENLGIYMREIEKIMSKYGLEGVPFGHFGDGCIHVRIDFPLADEVETFKNFISDASDLVLSLKGSPSGEHGDGRARSALLDKMYSPEASRLFKEFKNIFDPKNIMNPNIMVYPQSIESNLRRPTAQEYTAADGFNFLEDNGSFTHAIHRCVGIGKCRANNKSTSGFMCPSYQATKNEDHVTRGRARVLQETIQMKNVSFGNAALENSLKYCLSCKACASDCPSGVDMARYKSETLHRKYKGKIRPRNHYSLGLLPHWLQLMKKKPKLFNSLIALEPLRKILFWVGGIDQQREIPKLSTNQVSRVAAHEPNKSGIPVLLWLDSFSDSFSVDMVNAAISVLEKLGFRIEFPAESPCCGLTWISTGQLKGAKKKLSHLLDSFDSYVDKGFLILGLEPSCLSVLRSDLLDLLPGDLRTNKISSATRSFSELVNSILLSDSSKDIKIEPIEQEIIFQPHCHQYAVSGLDEERKLLQKIGADTIELSGCCGLAGNFGMEAGNYQMSVAVAENSLLPAIEKKKSEESILLADGLSCRTQVRQFSSIKITTFPQLLDELIK